MNVLDITDESEVLKTSDYFIQALDSGIHALALDFSFHIKNTFKDDRVFDLRNSISFRLRSSRYHFHLLFKELKQIQIKHDSLPIVGEINESPQYQIELDKRHLTYILDSLIFHLSSVFDYSAILVSFILTRTDSKPNWNSLENSARGKSNMFSNETSKEIKSAVMDIHNNFTRHLYDYRSEIIHRQADLIKGDLSWNLVTNKKTLLFRCSSLQLKSFRKLAKEDQQVSIPYFIRYLILETIESVAILIKSLRKFMEANSKSDEIIKKGGLVLGYADPVSKQMISPGHVFLAKF